MRIFHVNIYKFQINDENKQLIAKINQKWGTFFIIDLKFIVINLKNISQVVTFVQIWVTH